LDGKLGRIVINEPQKEHVDDYIEEAEGDKNEETRNQLQKRLQGEINGRQNQSDFENIPIIAAENKTRNKIAGGYDS